MSNLTPQELTLRNNWATITVYHHTCYIVLSQKGTRMTTPTALTPHQVDIIKTAAAIIHVIEDSSLHPSLRQTTPLAPAQIDALTRRFSEGLDHWDREVHNHRMPSSVDASRIAIAALLLDQRYPNDVRRDDRGEITISIADIADVATTLSGDISQYTTSHEEWETRLLSFFGPDPNAVSTHLRMGQAGQAAQRFGLAVAKSMGIDAIFHNAFEAGHVPEASVPALPAYPATDPRSQEPELMAKLQVELSVTEGLLAAITPNEPNEQHHNQLLHWFQERAATAIDTVTSLVVPSGLARLNAQLQDTQRVLSQSRDLLRTCLYGTEAEVASEAAQHAVERSVGTILFLAIFPNIPFVIPTLELRLAITKPLYYVTKGAHASLGGIPIFGFLFLLLRWAGEAVDAIPRFQVRVVQGVVMENWLGNPRKRANLIRRYLRYADRRATKPRVDALQRILLGIVS